MQWLLAYKCPVWTKQDAISQIDMELAVSTPYRHITKYLLPQYNNVSPTPSPIVIHVCAMKDSLRASEGDIYARYCALRWIRNYVCLVKAAWIGVSYWRFVYVARIHPMQSMC